MKVEDDSRERTGPASHGVSKLFCRRKDDIFRSKPLVIIVLLSFVALLGAENLSQTGGQAQSEFQKVFQAGKKLYEEGEYEKAVLLLIQAITLASEKKDIAESYLFLSLAYYGLGADISKLYIKKLFEIQPEIDIDARLYPSGFVTLFYRTKSEVTKPQLPGTEEKQKAESKAADKKLQEDASKPVAVRGRPEAEPQAKKKGKFPWLLIGGIAVVGGAVAVLLLTKKKSSDTGNSTTTSIPGGSSTTSIPGSTTTTSIPAFFVDWILIPAGYFQMGDNFNEGNTAERPVHTVYLSDYFISKYEVTFDQYDTFCSATGRTKPSDNGWGRGSRPVINVSWQDAVSFCDWLKSTTGQNVHLPTDAQWEKAARGTDQRRYPWGNGDPTKTLANYDYYYGMTMPVGSFPAGVSSYGLHDMAGNVLEYCSDWYDPFYYKYSPETNPQGPVSGEGRVVRSGYWSGISFFIRSAWRHFDYTTSKSDITGFRICKD